MIKIENNVFTSFLSLLNVKFTRKYANKYFNEHPHKYNLFGLSKLLSDYGVKNAGIRVKDKKQDLYDVETLFIAHFGNDFVVVDKTWKDKVSYHWNGKKMTVSSDSFLEVWDGIILLAETFPESIEPDYKKHKKEVLLVLAQKVLLFIAIFLILLFFLYSQYFVS